MNFQPSGERSADKDDEIMDECYKLLLEAGSDISSVQLTDGISEVSAFQMALVEGSLVPIVI